MKLLHTLTALAIAAAITLAGCSNTFTGSNTDDSVLREYNSANGGSLGSVTFNWIVTPTKAAGQILEVTFTASDVIDVDSIPAAVKFRNLSNAASAEEVFVQGSNISYSIKEVRQNKVYLDLNLIGASDEIELFVDSTKLTGKKGSLRLNLDGDNVQGESNDDDYYDYLDTVAIPTPVVGVVRDPRVGFSLTPAGFTLVGTPSPTTLATVDTFTMSYGGVGYDNTDYTALFDANLVIEQYNVAGNTWTTLPRTSPSTYNTTTGVYVTTFTAPVADKTIRARITNVQNIKTSSSFYGFVQRYKMNSSLISAVLALKSVSDTDPSRMQMTSVNQINVFKNKVTTYFDANGLNGYILIDLDLANGPSGGIIGDKGLDKTTFTSENVKIYDTSSAVYVSYVPHFRFDPTISAPVGAETQVVLTLDPSYKQKNHSFNIFVGPGLRSLGDENTVPLGAARAQYFGDATEINNNPKGFKRINYLGNWTDKL